MTDELQNTLDALRHRFERPIVTVGNFDGVHIGHRAIIAGVVERAAQTCTTSVALTFEPHPVSWFKRLPVDTFRLTSPAHKIRLLQLLGVDHPVALPFSDQLAALSPDAFVEIILANVLDAAEVWVGWDFNFGRGRTGSPADLARLGAERGIEVRILDPVHLQQEVVSSTSIRKALQAGDLEHAARLLGRRHSVEGTVVHGETRGRRLGFPTANIVPEAGMMIPHGVYVTSLSTDTHRVPAVTNVGVRPTFRDDSHANVESFVLDGLPADTDLYGRQVEVELLAFLRPEHRFENAEALRAQVALDITSARRLHGLNA